MPEICPKCKLHVNEGATRCAHCGAAVGKAATVQAVAQAVGFVLAVWTLWPVIRAVARILTSVEWWSFLRRLVGQAPVS